MEEGKQFSEQESLALITRTIHEAQAYMYETGTGPLIYGFSVIICCALTWLKQENYITFPFHPFWLMVPVIFVQGLQQFNEEKKKKAKTFTDQAIDYVWTGFLISCFAAWCANFAGLEYVSISIILFLTGFATFLTGLIAKFKYSIICGCICLVLGILSFFMLNPGIYLLLGAAAVLVWVVPGFLLRAYFKKQQHAA